MITINFNINSDSGSIASCSQPCHTFKAEVDPPILVIQVHYTFNNSFVERNKLEIDRGKNDIWVWTV